MTNNHAESNIHGFSRLHHSSLIHIIQRVIVPQVNDMSDYHITFLLRQIIMASLCHHQFAKFGTCYCSTTWGLSSHFRSAIWFKQNMCMCLVRRWWSTLISEDVLSRLVSWTLQKHLIEWIMTCYFCFEGVASNPVGKRIRNQRFDGITYYWMSFRWVVVAIAIFSLYWWSSGATRRVKPWLSHW